MAGRPKASTVATLEGAPPAKRARVVTSTNSAKSKATIIIDSESSTISTLTPGVSNGSNGNSAHVLTQGVKCADGSKNVPRIPGSEFFPLRTPGDCVLLRGRTWHMSRPSEPNRFLLKLVVFFKFKKFVRVKFESDFCSDLNIACALNR